MGEKQDLINGFSKLSSIEKLNLVGGRFQDQEEAVHLFRSFHHSDKKMQKLLEEFSENTITNFPMPYGICPNVKVNGKTYMVPMVIEESSVVAAASNASKYWHARGGFHAEVTAMEKIGQVHFIWKEDKDLLKQRFAGLTERLKEETAHITENMRKRGGGIREISLKDYSGEEPGLMQINAIFNTVESMGANFINSCLEQFAVTFKNWFDEQEEFSEGGLEIILCILSNYTPNCKVKCYLETDISSLDDILPGMSGKDFVEKFRRGIRVAEVDVHRSTTNNKGIMNGVDAVILATGNDFRAVEACCHTYAARSGRYTSLSHVDIEGNRFRFYTELPFAVGVVGGLTNLHPLVKLSLELLDHPTAEELMQIAAAVGLANNFSAVKNLVTVGIQKGHMKMHLLNILNQLKVAEKNRQQVVDYFKDKVVSVSAVRNIAEKWNLI